MIIVPGGQTLVTVNYELSITNHRSPPLTRLWAPASFQSVQSSVIQSSILASSYGQAYVSSSQQASDPNAWISYPDVDAVGTRSTESQTEEGSEEAHGQAADQVRRRLIDLRFPRSYRLTRRADLNAVSRDGKRIRTEHLELRVVASLLHHPRVGLIVPKHGHTNVQRNRLKRHLREAIRRDLIRYIPLVDVVIRARREAYNVPLTGRVGGEGSGGEERGRGGLAGEIGEARLKIVTLYSPALQ